MQHMLQTKIEEIKSCVNITVMFSIQNFKEKKSFDNKYIKKVKL